jgi:hypothetical protein
MIKAKISLYKMKGLKLLFLRYFTKNLTLKKPTKKLAKKPISRGYVEINLMSEKEETNLKIPARKIIGTDIKNENLVELSLLKPESIPPLIVEPDLEKPGKSAKT